MRGKKAAAHFEMIMAFIFFIGFIAFLFFTIKPYDEDTLSYSTIQGIQDRFIEQTKTNYTKMFLKTGQTPGGCINLDLTKEMFKYDIVDSSTYITDIDGNKINSEMTNTMIYIEAGKDFHYVTISPTFTESTVPCSNEITGYEIGGLTEKEVVSIIGVQNLEQQFRADYEETKNTLGVPPIYDFSINITGIGIGFGKTTPEEGDILAKDYMIEVLNITDGKIINTKMNIKIW